MSKVYETAPWGVESQAQFLNMAVEVDSGLGPYELLRECKQIEKRSGRDPGPRWSARTIDIDILLFEGVQLDTPELSIPHPLMSGRAFVLIPLSEIAPDAVLPDGSRVEELARQAQGEVRVYGAIL
jgi:2-amino-4-hydroxy-6-hydroxymethyldihydropteridine diphosphokinase